MAGVTVVKQVVAEMRAKTDELERALTEMEGKAKRTKTEVEGVGGAVGKSAGQYGAAARQIASATENIARSGNVSGDAAKQILTAGSSIAFAFGPGGAVVGALSIFALAATTAFRTARAEAEEAQRAFDATLEKFRLARDFKGAGGLVVSLLQGDPTAENEAERLGLLRLREQVARERAAQARTATLAAGPVIPLGERAGLQGIADRPTKLKDLEAALASLEARYKQAEATFTIIAQQEQERLGNEKRTAEEEKALLESRTAVRKAFEESVKQSAAAIAAFDRDAADFGKGFDAFVLSEVATNADRVAEAFDRLIEQGRRTAGSSDPRVQRLVALREAAVSAARAIDESQATIRELDLLLATGGQPTVDTFQQLTADAARLRSELARLQKGSKEYLAVQQQLLAVEQKRQQLLGGVGSSGSATSGAARSTADLAREIQQAVDGALQLATAFGAVDAGAAAALRSVAQIAGNIPALQTALASGSGLGVIAAGLPILGALASLLPGGNSAAEQARREELRRNTDALKALTEKAGLLGLNATGADTSAALSFARFVRENGVAVNDTTLAQFGLTLTEIQRIAETFGIKFGTSARELDLFIAALSDTITKLGEFGTDLDSQLKQADAEIQLRGITDPLEKLAVRLGALGGRSSAFDGLTAGLDLNTAEGRNAARANALALFDVLKAGGATLDAEALGGLTGEELLQAILDLVASLNEADEGLGITSGTQTEALQVSAATQITADQASRLLGLSSSQLTVQREIRDLLATAIAAAGTPLPLPSAAVFAQPAAGGGTVTITIENVFNGPVADPAALGAEQLAALTEHIRRALGTDVQIRQQYAGRIVS